MPLNKLTFRPGITKEITSYANEGGYYFCNLTRFRSGYAEKIGGWVNYSPGYTFSGVCRSMFNWISYTQENLLALGTNQKFYVENGGQYYDITPVAYTSNLTNTFTTVSGSPLVTVSDPAFFSVMGTYVTFTGVSTFNGVNLNGSYEIINTPTSTTYTIIAPNAATGSGSGGGSYTASYQINAGNAVYSTTTGGWGVSGWGLGGWGGSGAPAGLPIALWSASNDSQNLIFARRNGALYYWVKDTVAYAPAVTINAYANTQVKATYAATFAAGATSISVPNYLYIDIGATVTGIGIPANTIVGRGYLGGLLVPLTNYSGASVATTASSSGNYTFSYSGATAPNQVGEIVTSSNLGFAIALGATPYNPQNFNPAFDPMVVRWSDQSVVADWAQTTTNQAGQQRLSNGSYIVGSVNTRQEILVWTDQSLYSMQYLGPPFIFGFTSLMDNISVMSPNCMTVANGITYWMGTDKFYVYTGTVSTLPCSLRKFVFTNINLNQAWQVVAGFNERYNEVWWIYPSLNSQVNDSYVIYNYLENIWYYGSLNRTFWYDSSLRPYPMAAFSVQTSYLSAAIGFSDTSLTLLNGVSYPATGTVVIGSEQISYKGITGNTLTGLVRGINGTTATSHSAYATVAYLVPNQILYHENGVDDLSGPTPQPIYSYVQTSDIDISGGDHYAFVWRMLPDIAFAGSTASSPQVMLTVIPRDNAGTAYQTNPAPDQPSVTSTNTYPIEQFTGEVFTRVRGRQMAFRLDSPNLGVQWQLGNMRYDLRQDGRR